MSKGLQLTKLKGVNKTGVKDKKHDLPIQGKERKAETCSGGTEVIAFKLQFNIAMHQLVLRTEYIYPLLIFLLKCSTAL